MLLAKLKQHKTVIDNFSQIQSEAESIFLDLQTKTNGWGKLIVDLLFSNRLFPLPSILFPYTQKATVVTLKRWLNSL